MAFDEYQVTRDRLDVFMYSDQLYNPQATAALDWFFANYAIGTRGPIEAKITFNNDKRPKKVLQICPLRISDAELAVMSFEHGVPEQFTPVGGLEFLTDALPILLLAERPSRHY